jgi:hypothetical protein
MTLGSHQATVGRSQVHLTPRWIIDALGPFDLDPCAAVPRPWDCARQNITSASDGLACSWSGRIWLNPPFDRYKVGAWVGRLAAHGNGIALLHARTEARWFRPAWDRADGILFLGRRIKFCRADGSEHPANSGAPPVLVAFGADNATALASGVVPGFFVHGWTPVSFTKARSVGNAFDPCVPSQDQGKPG